MEESQKLSQFVSGVTYEDLPVMVVDKTKELILDQLGCQLAGSTLPWSKATYEYVNENKGQREESTIVNYGIRTMAQDAAFANANFGHALMGDDTDSVCNAHLGAIIIPAALAVAEREMISGKELIQAVVAGYEVSSRIGAAAPLAESRGFHPGPIFGPFGAAACTGKILGFHENRILDAMSIAGSHSSGLMEYSRSGGTVNRLHAGIAAYGGIRAALLVQKGFNGPATILEGDRGFIHAFSGEYHLDEITRGLGKEFRVMLIGLKAYWCCGTLGAGLDAVTAITDEHHIAPEKIKEIIVNAPPAAFSLTGTIKEPRDITSAQFSGRFGIALRLLKGGNSFKEYTEENLKDHKVLDLAAKIEYISDDSLAKVPASDNATKVVIRMTDGAVYENTAYAAKGTILNPMSTDEISQKFKNSASGVLPDDEIEAIIKIVASLDSVANVCELSRLLVVS